MSRELFREAFRTPAGLLKFVAGVAVNLSGAAVLLWHATEYTRGLTP
ncbi:MAG: hypothetical protein RMK97_10485 [Sutterellaceae bacterium]|nr:hypothetical protein [Burkholderiaceae bacterium]MDW8430908.1 hypothetical protein [Sutterellaceae bacterium]